MRYNYMMRQYIERISDTPEKQERLINNAVEATKSATTEWSKDFWFGIFTKFFPFAQGPVPGSKFI